MNAAQTPNEYEIKNFERPLVVTPISGQSSAIGAWQLHGFGEIQIRSQVIARLKPNHSGKLNTVEVNHLFSHNTLLSELADGSALVALTTDTNLQAVELAAVLSRHPSVDYAQPDIQPVILPLNKHTSEQSEGQNFAMSSDAMMKAEFQQGWLLTKGRGVRVAVIDDGIMTSHEDLIGTNWTFQADASEGRLNAAPVNHTDRHGTRVAGIIFAAHNHVGANGVAPEADAIAIRLASGWTSDVIIAFELAKQAGADVVNCSWGLPILMQPVADSIESLAKTGRKGKGVAVVFAAGNRYRALSQSDIAGLDDVIAVTAVDDDMRLRGAFGDQVDVAVRQGWLTTLVTNKRGKKYGQLGATSGAAPVVSGVIALMLSINPNLTLQDIKRILISTSEVVESRDSNLKSIGMLNVNKALAAVENELEVDIWMLKQ